MTPKTIEVYCPTLNRPDWADRFRESVENQIMGWDLKVVLSLDVQSMPRSLISLVNGEFLLARERADVVFVMADHLVLANDCLATAVVKLFEAFPDGDGMVGLNIENTNRRKDDVSEFCFYGLGTPFLERFKTQGYQALCPDYYHFFAETELGLYAKNQRRFVYAEGAKVKSFHPNHGEVPKDGTHKESRKYHAQEARIWDRRRSQGWLWGKDWNREWPQGWESVPRPSRA